MADQVRWPQRSPWIRQATEALPRERFAPRVLWSWDGQRYVAVDQEQDPERWARVVYAGPDEAAITQLANGRPSSSLSCESVVVDMLDVLLLEPHHKVLELGAGTGRNAALLARRASRVVSVECDPLLADQARTRLAEVDADVVVVAGDGDTGWPDEQPYDRVVATYAVERVPWAWVAQSRPGGRVVTPWGRMGLVALTVAADGQSASGWMQGLAMFMSTKSTCPGRSWDQISTQPVQAERRLDRDLAPLHTEGSLRFALRIAPPEVVLSTTAREGRITARAHDGLASWATLTQDPPQAAVLRQAGPRRLADELLAAWTWWEKQGAPHLYDFGMTVTATSQHVWCRDPAAGPYWPPRRRSQASST
ncbi:methyltransferase domain-containing protein [Streptomyces youssoufiensis]